MFRLALQKDYDPKISASVLLLCVDAAWYKLVLQHKEEMTLGPLSNRIGNSKCKQGFLHQGTEIGNQPVLSSSDQEFRKK